MKVEVQRRGSVTVVVPHDALTETTVGELEELVAGENGQSGARLVLDLGQVPFADSAGIELLLRFAGDRRAGSLRPRVVKLSETVREALDLTNTLERFLVFDSVEAAVRSYV